MNFQGEKHINSVYREVYCLTKTRSVRAPAMQGMVVIYVSPDVGEEHEHC